MDRKIIVRLIEGESFNLIARELKVGKRRIKRIYTKAFGAGYITLIFKWPRLSLLDGQTHTGTFPIKGPPSFIPRAD